jgi:hypothetical protein
MNSITERILAARERGFTSEAISAYEEIPVSEVELVYDSYHPGSDIVDLEVRQEARHFLEENDVHEVEGLVEDVQMRASRTGADGVKEAAIELVHRYHIEPDVALSAISQLNRGNILADIEIGDREVRLQNALSRLRSA